MKRKASAPLLLVERPQKPKPGQKGFIGPLQRVTHPRRNTVIPGLLRTKGEEKKVLFTGQGTAGSAVLACNTTGTILALNLITVGSSMFNRIGRRVEMVSVRLEAFLQTLNVTRTCPNDYCRMMIVYDRQTNGGYPAIQDVIQDTDQQANNTTTAMSGLNMNNRERFVTLMDKRIYLPYIALTAGGSTPTIGGMFWQDTVDSHVIVNEFRRLSKLTMHFKADSATAVIGDIATGGLYVICITSVNAAGAEGFNWNWNARLKYVDI